MNNNIHAGNRSGKALGLLVILLFVAILAVIIIHFDTPPKGKGAEISQNAFSSERAFKHLENIAQEPHTPFLPELERVREYIVKQMEDMGLDVVVESYPWKIDRGNGEESVVLHNIIGLLKGTDEGKALMMSAHYDSVTWGPGANDDGVAVASLLETIRALKSGPKLRNDILFVITDGEEGGLLGAKGFWSESEFRNRIGLVVNFEARGSRGASIMFQTSSGNSKLIQSFAEAATRPVSNSFLADIYRYMPNDTDLTVSLEHGVPGLNFAYVEGWDLYHTAEDTMDHVSMDTFQHHGMNALAMAEQFGNMDLSNLRGGDDVYFNAFGLLIHYPQAVTLVLTVLLAIAWAAILIYCVSRRKIRGTRLGISLLAMVLCIVFSALVSYLLFMLLGLTQLNNQVYHFGYLLVTLLIHMAITIKLKKMVNELDMLIAASFVYLILLIASVNFAPGASYLFALPLIVHVVVIALTQVKKRGGASLQKAWIILILSIMPVILFTPLFHLLFTAMPPLVNIACAVLFSLNLLLLYPLVRNMTDVFSSGNKKEIKTVYHFS